VHETNSAIDGDDLADRPILTSMLHEAQVSQSAGFVHIEDGQKIVSAGMGLTKKVHVASVSKAIGSLAVPFLLSEGRLDSLDQPLGPIVGWSVDDPRHQITMEHVLSHTTGLHTPDYSEWIQDVRHSHRIDVTGADLEVSPGTRFEYSNRSIELVSVVVTKLVGVSLEEYLSERLFKPLQIDVSWLTGSDGHTRVHAGLSISARDLAKLGNVLANDGSWNGNQMVPPGWLSGALESAGGVLPGEFRRSWRVNSASSSLRHTGDSGALLLIDLQHGAITVRTYDDETWAVSDHKQLRSTRGIRRAIETRW
jgi:CubicO group peptidase (beta-lactamase class C family)